MIYRMKGTPLQPTEKGQPFRLAPGKMVWVPKTMLTKEGGDYFAELGPNWKWYITDDAKRRIRTNDIGQELAEEYPEAVEIHE